MKLNIQIPSTHDLILIYNKLQSGSPVPIDKLSNYIQISRFDARLFEILARYFSECFPSINPFELNSVLKNKDWPAALGAILNHSRLLTAERKLFDHWMQISLNEIQKANGELYFLGQFDFNSRRIKKIISRCSKLFLHWGYLHDEIVLNKSDSLNKTSIAKLHRLEILKKLKRSMQNITVEQYRNALNYQISLRQAQRDLQNQ